MINEEEAERILRPYKEIFGQIMKAATDKFRSLPDDVRPVCKPRTRANFINDFMGFYARQQLEGMGGIRLSPPSRSTFYVYIENRFKVKLKKLDENRRPRNNPTKASKGFLDQTQREQLPEMPEPLTNLFAGYQWHRNAKAPEDICYFICTDGDQNAWQISIERKLQPAMRTVELIPASPPQPPRAVPKERLAKADRDGER